MLKGVDKANPFYYQVHIAARRGAIAKVPQKNGRIVLISQHILMESSTHKNLDFFQREFSRIGAYFLAPAEMTSGEPKPIMELRILKREFHIDDAWKIDGQHEDALAIRDPENVLVPDGVTNPPIRDLTAQLNSRSHD